MQKLQQAEPKPARGEGLAGKRSHQPRTGVPKNRIADDVASIAACHERGRAVGKVSRIRARLAASLTASTCVQVQTPRYPPKAMGRARWRTHTYKHAPPYPHRTVEGQPLHDGPDLALTTIFERVREERVPVAKLSSTLPNPQSP